MDDDTSKEMPSETLSRLAATWSKPKRYIPHVDQLLYP